MAGRQIRPLGLFRLAVNPQPAPHRAANLREKDDGAGLQRGLHTSFLWYDLIVRQKKQPVRTTKLEEHRLKGNRKGAVLKEQVWFEDGRVVAYSLAYINLRRCPVDNGRVLAPK